MGMANITEFLTHVITYVPGCSEPLALQQIRDVCIDFCSKTSIWQETLDSIDVAANTREYLVQPPLNSQILSIAGAWYKRRPIGILNADSSQLVPEQLASGFAGEQTAPGEPNTVLYSLVDKSITVNPVPASDLTAAITLRVVLRPTRTATTVPDFLLTDYEYAIAQGAISRITRIPGQTFTDFATSALTEREYISARNQAMVRANKTFSRSQASIKMRPF